MIRRAVNRAAVLLAGPRPRLTSQPLNDWPAEAAWRRRAIVRAAVLVGVLLAVVVALTACGSDATASTGSTASPGDGWRHVADTPAGWPVLARCDGSTLLYVVDGWTGAHPAGASITAIPGAGECTR